MDVTATRLPKPQPRQETLDDLLGELDVCDAEWRIGNYQVLEEIGRGGMGVIYRARQRHSRRIVALKRILSYHADSQETLARFRRESQAAASLDHPNILPIYEVSECDDGLPFFSMKFAGGGSLLDAAPALRGEPRRSVALVAKVARAVQYAHGQGILHRDLKPGNVLLDGRGEPLVSDFGLAKWLDTSSHLTRTLTIFGTPGYIAPEQVNGSAGKLGPASDVYSLGAILFDLLTGRPPFLGENALKGDPASEREAGAEAAHIGARAGSGLGDDLLEMFGAGTRCALSLCGRSGRRPRTLAGRPPHCRASCFAGCARVALDAAESSYCGNGSASAGVGIDSWCDDLERRNGRPASGKWRSGSAFRKFECR